MIGKHHAALPFRQISAHTSRQHTTFDEPGYFLIVQSIWSDILALAGDSPEEEVVRYAR